jgi:hypothetical protein
VLPSATLSKSLILAQGKNWQIYFLVCDFHLYLLLLKRQPTLFTRESKSAQKKEKKNPTLSHNPRKHTSGFSHYHAGPDAETEQGPRS